RVVRRALDTAIPANIVIAAVLVVFAIGFIVFFVVAHQVFQRETIVAGHEVDAGVGPAAALLIEIAAAAQAGGKFGNRAPLPLPETADGIAILAVPLCPQHREIADLVAAFPHVPRLGNQLDLRQ